MIPTDAMDPHWVESRPVTDDATRLSGFHSQASGLDYTHVNPTNHQAIATPDSTTPNTKHPSIPHLGRMPYPEAFGNASTNCQVPRSDGQGRLMLHYVKDGVGANKHKVCYILAVGFVWYPPGPVNAKTNMACAGL